MGIKMKVVSINDKREDEVLEARAKSKQTCLEILEEMRTRIESGEIQEFVAASTDESGAVEIHCALKDYLGGVGMFEMGKYTLTQIIVADYEE
jgi:hypothetical protein